MVSLNGVPTSQFRTAKTRALLTYLSMENGRSHQRQTLANLLWPEMPTELSLKNLRLTLHRLRQTLDDHLPDASRQLFTITRQSVQLHGANVTTDVAEFQRLIAACEAHAHRHLHECDVCLKCLVQAANLYGGELLAGFSVDDAQTFEEWLLIRREELNQQYLFVLHHLAAAYRQQGDLKHALEFARRLPALDPFYEAGYQLTMQILAASGRRSEALAVYENGRQLFLSQLGVEPIAETTAIYEQIRDDPSAYHETPATKNPVQLPRLHHFPAQVTPFYGREAELNQLKALLLADECRLVTVIGPGGIGKTRLSIRAAEQIAENRHHADDIYYIALDSVETSEKLAAAIFAGLGLKIHEKTEPRTQLFEYLRDKCCLLVLDNFEQLIGEALLLADMLAAAPEVQLLVTSRFALNLRAERRLLLHGLAYPKSDKSMQEIAAYSSVRLFVESSRRVAPQFRLTPQNQTAVMHICQLVHGLPLALEIAGAWMRLMDAEAIESKIRQNLEFLATPMKDVPSRHRSMTAVFTSSWQLLSQPEQITLAQLSVFHGEFSMQTAVSVTGTSLATLGNLLDYSLLQRTVNGRYEMHELTHQFAEQKLNAIENGTQLRQQLKNRHSDYYLAYVAAAWSDLHGPQPQLTMAALQHRRQNIYHAWQWAFSRQRWQPLRESVDALGYFYELSGLIHDGVELFADAIPPLQTSSEAAAAELLGKVLIWHGYFLHRQGMLDEAVTAVNKSRQIAEEKNLPDLRMQALTLLATIKSLQGTYQQAYDYLQEAIAYYEEKCEKQNLADGHGSMGYLLWRRSRYDEAKTYLEKGLKLQHELGNVVGQARQTNILGLIYRQQGNLVEADYCFRQALIINQALGYQDGISKNLANLSIVLRQQGKFEQALTANLVAEEAFQKLGYKEGVALLVGNRGIIYQSLGNFEGAAACFELALQLDTALGNQAGIARHLGNMGYLKQTQNELDQALAYYEQAIPILRDLGSAYFLSTPLLHKAEVLLEQSDYEAALALAREGLQLSQQAKRADNIALGHIVLARIEYAQGYAASAREMLMEQIGESGDNGLVASFHYELWRMGAGTSHAAEATALYRDIYGRMPDNEYKVRLEELEAAGFLQTTSSAQMNGTT